MLPTWISKYLTNIEENVEDYFYGYAEEDTNNQFLNDPDDMEIDWIEINLEQLGSMSEPFSTMHDKQEVVIEEVSAPMRPLPHV